MPIELAQTLLAENMLEPAVLEPILQQCLATQDKPEPMHLDSALLDAGLLPEAQLASALASTYHLDVARPATTPEIDAYLPKLIPVAFVETYHLIPYKLVGNHLYVFAMYPPTEETITAISTNYQLSITPLLMLQVRWYEQRYHGYGICIPNYLNTLLDKLKAPPVAAPTSYIRALSTSIAEVSSRDAVINILLSFTTTCFEYTAIFLVQHDTCYGFCSSGAGIKDIEIPLGLPSVLQTVYATGSLYLGPLQPNRANTDLLTAIQRQSPHAVFVAPIYVAKKIVALMYTDNATKPISPHHVAALLVLLNRASLKFEQLIIESKNQQTNILQHDTQTMLQQLESKQAKARFAAVAFFKDHHTPQACEAICRRLYDKEPQIRQLAVETLKQYRHAPAYENLIEALLEQVNIPIPQTQAATMQILAHLREARAVPLLEANLQSSNQSTTEMASLALAMICKSS